MTREKRALLIVHAWMEPGSDRPLRAHMRATADVEAGFGRDLTLSNIDAACDGVRDWLERVVRGANDPDPGATDTSEF
jgi:hypothetical protein